MQGSPDGTVVWIPFQTIEAGGYPLEVVPGSHVDGPLPWEADPAGSKIAPGVQLPGAVALPGSLGLGSKPSARTNRTVWLTVGIYALGGLTAGVAYRCLAGRQR